MAGPWILVFACCAVLLALASYLIHVNSRLKTVPKELAAVTSQPWTAELIRETYNKYRQVDDDFKKYLPPKQNRRYVVFGGSGLVGGWIVEHLILRGQDPNAVRIADIQAPRRQRAVENNVPYFKTDVTDPNSVARVFEHPWSPEHADLPLTVFHTVAYIHAGMRKADLLGRFMQVNVEGTKNVLDAARSTAGCDTLIVTSSSSIGTRPINMLLAPWNEYPDGFVQFSDNAEPQDLAGPLEQFAGCYAYSKARAEKLVRDADDKKAGFRTGAIRPGHAIYGHGDANPNSVVYDYLRRGGLSTWMSNITMQLVSAQNVSLAHLLFEARIRSHDLGGRAYAVSDSSPPIRYGDLYRFLEVATHPATPIKFPVIPIVPVVLLSYLVEAYCTVQRRHLRFLPEVGGDLLMVQPALFNYSTINVVYDDSKARRELGYTGTGTLEGLSRQVMEWNDEVEAKLAAGKAESKVRNDVQDDNLVKSNVPIAPTGVAR